MKILKEPLFHFMLVGAAMFGVHSALSRSVPTTSGDIVVTQGRIEALAAAFDRTWQRPPTARELDGLIGDYVREEVYTREAIALRLDQDDIVIRRRLRQKLEFVSEDVAAETKPTDDQLRSYLTSHAEAFRVESRLTFRQVFLDPGRRADHLSRHAAQILAQLRKPGSDAEALGDSRLLEHSFDALSAGVVADRFGGEFAAKLGEAPIAEWYGPVTSGYGAHLVFVSERAASRIPALEEVRDAVRRDWTNAQRFEANEKLYQTLLQRYAVTVERPPATRNDQLARVGQ